MPAYSGVEKLPGLSAEVLVWRDAYGVPHIFSSSMDDAARALGYIHASERMFQMDILRRVGQGRMAEIRGGDLLGVDKFVRTLGFYREAESSFSALSPWAQKRLEAYAQGVNAFLANHPLPPEFLLAGDNPEPWEAEPELVGHQEKIEAAISCPGTTRSSFCALASLASLDRSGKVGCFRAQGLAIPSQPCRPKATLMRAASRSMKNSAP